MIMAAQDQALRTNLASKMCLQSVGCAEKLIRQLAILYRNSRNFLTFSISTLEARQGGAGGLVGPMWKAGL